MHLQKYLSKNVATCDKTTTGMCMHVHDCVYWKG